VQPPPPYRSLPGLSYSNFHQTVSSVLAVPRGGCPAYGKRQLAALRSRLYRYMVQSFRPGISARSRSSALVCAPFRPRPSSSPGGCATGESTARLVRPLKPRADRRALRIACCLVASSPALGAAERFLRSGRARRFRLGPRPLPSGDFPPSAGSSRKISSSPLPRPSLCRLAWWARRLSARATRPSENHSPCAGSDRMILRWSLLWPGLRRLALFRSALRAPVICSPVLLRRPEEQITEARWSLRSNPFGGFSFFQVASLPQVNGSLRSVLCSG